MKEQNMEMAKSTNICSSDFQKDKGLSFDNFSTTKKYFANTCNKEKNDIEVINSPTNLMYQNTKKRLVKDIFLLPTSRSTKAALDLQ